MLHLCPEQYHTSGSSAIRVQHVPHAMEGVAVDGTLNISLGRSGEGAVQGGGIS